MVSKGFFDVVSGVSALGVRRSEFVAVRHDTHPADRGCRLCKLLPELVVSTEDGVGDTPLGLPPPV